MWLAWMDSNLLLYGYRWPCKWVIAPVNVYLSRGYMWLTQFLINWFWAATSCISGAQNSQFLEKYCTSLAILLWDSHCTAGTRYWRLMSTVVLFLTCLRKRMRALVRLKFWNYTRSMLFVKLLIALGTRSKSIWAMTSMRSWQARALVRVYWRVYPCPPILVFAMPLGSLVTRLSSVKSQVSQTLWDFANNIIYKQIQMIPCYQGQVICKKPCMKMIKSLILILVRKRSVWSSKCSLIMEIFWRLISQTSNNLLTFLPLR